MQKVIQQKRLACCYLAFNVSFSSSYVLKKAPNQHALVLKSKNIATNKIHTHYVIVSQTNILTECNEKKSMRKCEIKNDKLKKKL